MGITTKWFWLVWYVFFGFKPGTMIESRSRCYLMWYSHSQLDNSWIDPGNPVMFLGYNDHKQWMILGPTRSGYLMLEKWDPHEFEVWHDF